MRYSFLCCFIVSGLLVSACGSSDSPGLASGSTSEAGPDAEDTSAGDATGQDGSKGNRDAGKGGSGGHGNPTNRDSGLDAREAGKAGSSGPGNGRPGSPCSTEEGCLSGLCVDEVCCTSACAGLCETCVNTEQPGTCVAIDQGEDPDSECGPCRVCNGKANCESVADGTDPKDACPTMAESTCGTTGVCRSGECSFYDQWTVCGKGFCTDDQLSAPRCNGQGSCGTVGVSSCLPYLCDTDDSCKTTCDSSADCFQHLPCDPVSHVCMYNLPNGATCQGDSVCASQTCIDSVCCDIACDGFCEACNLPSSLGSCAPVLFGHDPDDECDGDSGCDGACDGARGCVWLTDGDSCDTGTECDRNQVNSYWGLTGPSRCDAFGNCHNTVACSGGYGCDPYDYDICPSECAPGYENCLPGYFCKAVSEYQYVCAVAGNPEGSDCSTSASAVCATGDCADPLDEGEFNKDNCPRPQTCVECDRNTDCPSGRCDDCQCVPRLRGGQGCNENSDCFSGSCVSGACR